MTAAEPVGTARRLLRKPHRSNAHTPFASYSRDNDVARYLKWRHHQAFEDSKAITEQFLKRVERRIGVLLVESIRVPAKKGIVPAMIDR